MYSSAVLVVERCCELRVASEVQDTLMPSTRYYQVVADSAVHVMSLLYWLLVTVQWNHINLVRGFTTVVY
jgi:hypothetical protein